MKNCIVKIINGVPTVFGEAGKDDMDSLVYIFEEEEAFDAALAAGLIPVGTLIVKTYDEVEMAGGPFDDALSTESENAPQNKVVANALSVKSSLTEYGMSKICPVETNDATESNGLVLGAVEKNALVEGTLAHSTGLIRGIVDNIGTVIHGNSVSGVEIDNGVGAEIGNITLGPGVWILYCSGWNPSGGANLVFLQFTKISDWLGTEVDGRKFSFSVVVSINAETEYGLLCTNLSGQQITSNGFCLIYAVKLK